MAPTLPTVPRLRGADGSGEQSGSNSTRQRIIDAAEACLDRQGLGKTTVEDVAAAAQVSRATVYRHFAHRDDLMLQVLLRDLDRSLERPLDDFLEGVRTPEALAQAIVDSAGYLLATIRTTPRLQLLLRTEGRGVADTIRGSSAALIRESADDLRPYFEAAQERGLLRPGLDLDDAAEWILRAILSLLTVDGLRPRGPAEEQAFLHQFLVPALVPDRPRRAP